MYNCRFETDNGNSFDFSYQSGVIFDVNVGDGVSVNIGTSQGFSQIGETVESQTLGSRDLTVEGKITSQNVSEIKEKLRKAFLPFTSGYFYFNDEYKIRCYVADTPSFSPVNDIVTFSLRLLCPYPFFFDVEEQTEELGYEVNPLFKFPLTLNSFKFGESVKAAYKNVYNDGDVSVPFDITIIAKQTVTEVTITNIDTFEFLKLNGTLNEGEQLHVYRDADNVLQIDKIDNEEEVTDAISYLDDDSELFELKTGDNLLSVEDSSESVGTKVSIVFKEAVVNLHEA